MSDYNPLTSPIPDEVPLSQAPLIRVIGQVRFSILPAVERMESLAPFQEAIRNRYPVLRQDRAQNVVLGPAGFQQLEPNTVWRFTGVGDGLPTPDGWSIALTKDFLALETKQYTSRQDFIDRFREALNALSSTFKPLFIDRLGVRYIDRIRGSDVANIKNLIQPQLLGILAHPVGANVDQHAVTDAVFSMDGGKLRARWGQLPPNSTIDPTAVEPIPEASWILDLDAFTANSMEFNVEGGTEHAKHFAERIYSFFRWAVTPSFLKRFGGEL